MNQEKNSHEQSQAPLLKQGDEIKLQTADGLVDARIKSVIQEETRIEYIIQVWAWGDLDRAKHMLLSQELLVQLFEPRLA